MAALFYCFECIVVPVASVELMGPGGLRSTSSSRTYLVLGELSSLLTYICRL